MKIILVFFSICLPTFVFPLSYPSKPNIEAKPVIASQLPPETHIINGKYWVYDTSWTSILNIINNKSGSTGDTRLGPMMVLDSLTAPVGIKISLKMLSDVSQNPKMVYIFNQKDEKIFFWQNLVPKYFHIKKGVLGRSSRGKAVFGWGKYSLKEKTSLVLIVSIFLVLIASLILGRSSKKKLILSAIVWLSATILMVIKIIEPTERLSLTELTSITLIAIVIAILAMVTVLKSPKISIAISGTAIVIIIISIAIVTQSILSAFIIFPLALMAFLVPSGLTFTELRLHLGIIMKLFTALIKPSSASQI